MNKCKFKLTNHKLKYPQWLGSWITTLTHWHIFHIRRCGKIATMLTNYTDICLFYVWTTLKVHHSIQVTWVDFKLVFSTQIPTDTTLSTSTTAVILLSLHIKFKNNLVVSSNISQQQNSSYCHHTTDVLVAELISHNFSTAGWGEWWHGVDVDKCIRSCSCFFIVQWGGYALLCRHKVKEGR